MCDKFEIIAERAEVLLTELAELVQAGPTLRFVHRFQLPWTTCAAGEEIWAVFIIHRGREIPLPLSLALRLVLNYLAETRHIPQSATQIAAGMHRSAFYVKHGMNSGVPSRRRISRSAVKEYVKRLRSAIRIACRYAALDFDPGEVLVSRRTVGNEIRYQLRAAVQWVHINEHISAPL
jgi:hypothetical protein